MITHGHVALSKLRRSGTCLNRHTLGQWRHCVHHLGSSAHAWGLIGLRHHRLLRGHSKVSCRLHGVRALDWRCRAAPRGWKACSEALVADAELDGDFLHLVCSLLLLFDHAHEGGLVTEDLVLETQSDLLSRALSLLDRVEGSGLDKGVGLLVLKLHELARCVERAYWLASQRVLLALEGDAHLGELCPAHHAEGRD